MPSFCSNCRTKYSVLNPEGGCSNCALSFCRKCLPHRALLPQFANKPVSVCSNCYEKLNENVIRNQKNNGTQITRISIGDVPPSQSTFGGKPPSKQWWGDGLPPPSMRSTADQPQPSAKVFHGISKNQIGKVDNDVSDINDLQTRWMESREEHAPSNVLTVSEIEERLAALRGCDVELIRRPRCIFECAEKVRPSGNTVQELIMEARDLAAINDRYDPVNELERRHKSLREEAEHPSHFVERESDAVTNDNGNDTAGPRLSSVSTVTSFSETTAKELEEINKLMEDAQKRVHATEDDEKRIAKEMKTLLAATRQKSLELEKVNREIDQFWNRQLDKSVDISDSDDDSVDDETVKKVILEAEQAAEDIPDYQPSSSALEPPVVQSSPKKSGFLTKIFRR